MRFPIRTLAIQCATAVGMIVVVLIMGSAVCATLAAQKMTVRLLNAKTGRVIARKKVTIRWANGTELSEILLDNNGQGDLQIPPGGREFFMMEGPRIGNEPNRIAYIDCNEPAMSAIQVAQVLERGVVPGNRCGHQSLVPRPGEVIFWALPLPWWRPDLQ